MLYLQHIIRMNLGFALLFIAACAPTQEQEKAIENQGQFTVEIGKQSLVLNNCLFRKTERPRGGQLVGTDRTGSLFFLEIDEKPSAGTSYQAGLFHISYLSNSGGCAMDTVLALPSRHLLFLGKE